MGDFADSIIQPQFSQFPRNSLKGEGPRESIQFCSYFPSSRDPNPKSFFMNLNQLEVSINPVFYVPIIYLQRKQITNVEALSRIIQRPITNHHHSNKTLRGKIPAQSLFSPTSSPYLTQMMTPTDLIKLRREVRFMCIFERFLYL